MTDWNRISAPEAAEIEAMARASLARLLAEFAPNVQDIVIQVAEFAPEEMLDELQIDDPFDLTGLYDGIPVIEKSVSDQPHAPDTIWLFRRPLLDEWASRAEVTLGELVAHIVAHELAHHFGWSDDDIASVDRWWE